MKKLLLVLLAMLLATSLIMVAACDDDDDEDEATPAETATVPEDDGDKETIKLGDLNWGSAHFQSAMAKIMIEEGYGYDVELVAGATLPLFEAVSAGDIDIFLEGWLQNQQEAVDAALAEGTVEMLGILNNDNWQSCFVIPTYVIEGDSERGIEPMAPNLNTVQDLADPAMVDLFENPENPGKGLLLNGPAGWSAEVILPQQVAAYGLTDDYDIVNAGSQEGLFASLTGAYEKGDPWLGYLWGPTWIAGKLDLTLLEEPAHDPQVWEENYACAWPSVDLFIAVHAGFSEEFPEITDMLSKWKMDTATLGSALAYQDLTGGEPVDVAIWFLKNREDLWAQFVSADAAEKIKEAVAGM